MIRWISSSPRVRVSVQIEQHQLVQRLAPEHDHLFDVPGSDAHRLVHRRGRGLAAAAQRQERGALEQRALAPHRGGQQRGQHLGAPQGLPGSADIAVVEVVAGAR